MLDIGTRPSQRDWDHYQQALIEAIVSSAWSVVSDAVPGSGKTTTIVEALWRLPARMRDDIVCTAQGKRITRELAERVPAGVYARNLNAIGHGAICRRWGDVNVAETMELVGDLADGLDRAQRVAFSKLVRVAKGRLSSTVDDVLGLIAEDDVDCGEEEPDEFAGRVMRALDRSTEPIEIDGQRYIEFADQLRLPVLHRLQMRSTALVVLDEAQDFSPAMIQCSLQLAGRGRVAAVGDPFQSIFRFAGAESTALADITRLTQARRFPLSVTYRCATKIVEVARRINGTIEPRPGAPDGEVAHMTVRRMVEQLRPGDVVLSRKNAPLLPLCMKLVQCDKLASVWGKDYGERLVERVLNWRPKSLTDLRNRVEKWCDKRVRQLEAQGRSTDGVRDEAECLRYLCDISASIDALLKHAAHIFSEIDDDERILLSTVHKFKGMEADRVFLLDNTFKLGESEEESFIWYVAVTRARDFLGFAEGSVERVTDGSERRRIIMPADEEAEP